MVEGDRKPTSKGLTKGNLLAHKLKHSSGKLSLWAQSDQDSSLCNFLSSPLYVGFCPQTGFSHGEKMAPAIPDSDLCLTPSSTREGICVPEVPMEVLPVTLRLT